MDALNINHLLAPVCIGASTSECKREDVCVSNQKPSSLTLRFTNQDCDGSFNEQGTFDRCEQPGDPSEPDGTLEELTGEDDVWVLVRSPNGKYTWFTGCVEPNQNFGVSSYPKPVFSGGNLVVEIWQNGGAGGCSQGGAQLMEVEFHVSCSQPLNPGDRYGGIEVINGFH